MLQQRSFLIQNHRFCLRLFNLVFIFKSTYFHPFTRLSANMLMFFPQIICIIEDKQVLYDTWNRITLIPVECSSASLMSGHLKHAREVSDKSGRILLWMLNSWAFLQNKVQRKQMWEERKKRDEERQERERGESRDGGKNERKKR